MAKITLPTIAAGYASNAAFNTAFGQIDAEFQSKVLYRNNPSGEPNTMQNLLDMNSNPINNVTMLTATGITVAGVNLTAKVAEAAASATAAAASAAAAVVSKNAAAASATAAAGYVDTFDDKYLGSKSSAPTVDNDGDALTDGALYFNTTSNIMFVYDLGSTTWLQLTLTSSNQTNVNTVAGISGNVTTVAGISANVTTVAGIASNVTSVAGNASNINTVAGAVTNINAVGSNISNVNAVAGNATNINTVAADASDIGAVAGKVTEIGRLGTAAAVADLALLGTAAVVADLDLLGTSANVTAMGVLGTSGNVTAMGLLGVSSVITDMATLGASGVVANISTVATNVAGVNSFADLYRGAQSSAPTGTITQGSLYYDTSASTKQLKIYDGSNWVNAAFVGGGAVTAFNGRNGSVTLNNADVVGALSTGAIATAKIADDAITADKLANSINSAITANTAKTGITSGQASAITANTAKTGITSGQASAITANTAKVTNATHSGEVTGATALTIANDAVTKAKVNFVSDGTAGVEVKGTSGVTDGYIQLNCSENSHGVKIKSPPHSAGASYTLTLPNNDGDADQVLKTNGSGVTSWGTVASGALPTIEKDMELASGGAVTAGKGVSINLTDGKVGLLPTLNTLGTISGTMSPSTNKDSRSTDGSRTLKMAYSGSDGSRVAIFTGAAETNANPPAFTQGSTTVSAPATYYNGWTWNNSNVRMSAIDETRFMCLVHTWNVNTSQEARSQLSIFVVTVDASGNCSKGTPQTYTGTKSGSGTWPSYVRLGFGRLGSGHAANGDYWYAFKVSGASGNPPTASNWTNNSWGTYSKAIKVSGTSLTMTNNTAAVNQYTDFAEVASDCTKGHEPNGFGDGVQFSMVIGSKILRSFPNESNTVRAGKNTRYVGVSSFNTSTGEVGETITHQECLTAAADQISGDGVEWSVLDRGHILAKFSNTDALNKTFQTFSVNSSTGVLTKVHTFDVPNNTVKNQLSLNGGTMFPNRVSSAGTQIAVGYTSSTINTMSLSATGQILGFNVGLSAPSGYGYTSSPHPYYRGGQWIADLNNNGVAKSARFNIVAAITNPYTHLGFAKTSSSSGNQSIIVGGVATGFSGLTPGAKYYTTADFSGSVTLYGTSTNYVGQAISATEILLNRNPGT
jgi:hypothetical protein